MNILKSTLALVVVLGCLVVILFGYRDIPLEQLKEKYAMPPSSFIRVDGMDVHFRDEGNLSDSLPIVLIHGTGASLHTFDGWAEQLADSRRVVRMDLPGYGLTGPFPDPDYSIGNYVRFLKRFLAAKEIDKCILGGNSLGGHIAWRFTVAHPEKVDKLILIDAAGYPFEAESLPLAFSLAQIPLIKDLFTFITPKSIARSSIENVYADKSKVTNEVADRYFELTLRAGNRQAFIDRFEAENDPNAYKQISQINQPTLILWGDQDLLIPTSNAKRFQKDLPNDTLVILEDAGHVPMEEIPMRSLVPVLAFIK